MICRTPDHPAAGRSDDPISFNCSQLSKNRRRVSRGKETVSTRLAVLGKPARGRMKPHFGTAGVSYPPARVVLVGPKLEQRLELFIHGNSLSTGCLAMGDSVAEELSVLTNDTGREKVKVVIAPVDFRVGQTVDTEQMPEWVDELYTRLRYEMPA